MKMGRIVLVIGFIAYVGSFFLTGVKDSNASPGASGYPGYICAYLTLLTPWGHDGMRMLQQGPLEYFSILFSGWINPFFLLTAFLLLRKPGGRFGMILRIVVVIMFGACWIVFHIDHVRPWTGYWLWTAAMLVVLFSGMFARQDHPLTTSA